MSMKVIHSSLFRAICSMAVGVMLIKYREEMMAWMVIAIGVLFFLSGIVSCASYLAQQHRYRTMKAQGITLYDSEGNVVESRSPVFPIVGIGSILLGLILAFMPTTFISWLMYILAALLALCAISQFVSLASACHYGKVGFVYWFMPSLLFLASMITFFYPEAIASAPLFFLGWCLLISGIVDCVNTIKIHSVRRKTDAVQTGVPEPVETSDEEKQL